MPRTSESKVLLIAISGTFMVMLDQTIMNTALPHIIAVFNETADRAQLVISAYLMASAISTPTAAFLVERFGIKRVYLFAQAGFLFGSILCGLSWDASSLITFRVLQGLCGGLLSPLAMTFLFTSVPPEDRGEAMALFGIPIMVAPAIGPTLGGYLVDYWSWRMCFYVNVPVVLLAIIMGLAWIDDTPKSEVSFDYKGFTLAAVGFSSVLYALSYAPTWHWNDWRIISLMSVGVTCILAWVLAEFNVKRPLLDLRMFKRFGYSLGIGLTFITTIGLFSMVFLMPLFLQTLRGFTALLSGLMVLAQAIGAMITMPLAGRLYDRFGPRAPALIGLALTGFATLSLQMLNLDMPDNTLRVILFIRGMGIGFAMMPIMTYALSSVPQKMTAQASSLLNVCRTIFGSLGIAFFATMLDTFQKQNVASIIQTVTPGSTVALGWLSYVQTTLLQMGYSLQIAHDEAITLLYEYVTLKANVTAFEMDFVISAVIVLLGIIPAMFLPLGRIKKPDGATGMTAIAD
ncbi:MAG: DHA2 family efflux MFS transporter permease subunit [Dehalococcoidia bacterium]|jgi:EmrB/QacA subfamily drug resistance transporter